MNFTQGKALFRASLIAAALLFAVPVFAQISIGIRIGPPPAPRVVAFRPASPGPDYMWVEGYWYPVGARYRWHEGFWTRPPYVGARWVGPRHDGQRFFDGYWDGEHGRVDRDHPWSAERERDFRAHERERDHDRDAREREVREREHDREHDRDYDRERDHDRDRDHEGDHDR
jgi:hypothetical protein